MGEAEQKIMKINLFYLGSGDDYKSPATQTSPRTRSSSFRPSLTKQLSQKGRCLCSPTTHAGSFRCRYHRNSGISGIRRTGLSIGSGLSELGRESVKSALSNLADKSTSNGASLGV